MLAALAETKSSGKAKPKKAKVVKKKAAASQGSGSGRRRKPFDIPPGDELLGHRAGTKRALLIEMLSGKGATFQEVQDAINWDRRTAYEGIKLLNKLGYGIQEKANGKIVLVKP